MLARVLLLGLLALVGLSFPAWATGPANYPPGGSGSGVVANTCTSGDFFSAVDGSGNFTCATPAGSGDVTAVGDCASGACFDGTSGTTLTGAGASTVLQGTGSLYFNLDTNADSSGDGFVVADNSTGTGGTKLFEINESNNAYLYNNMALRFREATANGSSAVIVTGPASMTTSPTIAFPEASGTVAVSATSPLSLSAAGDLSITADGIGSSQLAATFTATTITSNLVGNVTGNADTATTLAANPADCSADTYATTIAASGALTCSTVTNAGLAGSIAMSKTLLTADAGVALSTNSLTTASAEGSFITGTGTLPGTCSEGAMYQDTDSGGTELYICTASNTWTKAVAATDNVATATALAANPSDCGSDTYATTIAANGNLTCSTVSSAGIANGAIVNDDVNASAGILFSKLATTNTDRLLGRDTAGGGAVEELTVGGGVEFTGTGIQRSALTGDVTASAGSGTTAIGAGVIIDADVNASAAIASSKLAAAATDRILGRDTAGAGAVEELTVGGGLEFTGSGGLQRSALTGDVTASAGSGTTTIGANAVDLGADTTGNYVATVAGTSNEVSVSGSGSETAAVTVSLPSTIDLGGKTSFEVPNGAAPTTDAFGELAGDSDAWAASRGAPQWFDGTANTYLVGALASDTPADGQVPKWNTGGTITWENDSTGVIADLPAAGCNASTAASFWDLPSSNAPAAACYGSNYPRGVLDFDASTDETAYNSVMLPTPWTGSLYADIYWFATATTNETQWGVQVVCAGSSEPSDPSFNTVSTVSTTVDGTTTDVTKSTVTVATTTGCSAGEIMHVKLYRDADAGGGVDDMTGDARLLRVVLRQ